MKKHLKTLVNFIIIKFLPEFSFKNASYIGKDYFLNIKKNLKKEAFPLIDEFIENKGLKKIDSDWLIELALKTQIVIKISKINVQHGKILYGLVDKLCKKNTNFNILETGTARGFSSICMSKAISENNSNGKIFTLDFIPNNKKMYWNCISDFDGKKTRLELLENYKDELKNIEFIQGFTKNILKKLDMNKIHFAFLDGSHKYKDVKLEFEYVKKRQSKEDIIFFDDYTPGKFDGVVKLINEIRNANDYEIKEIFSSKERGYILATKN